jgi:hypothetical protein
MIFHTEFRWLCRESFSFKAQELLPAIIKFLQDTGGSSPQFRDYGCLLDLNFITDITATKLCEYGAALLKQVHHQINRHH